MKKPDYVTPQMHVVNVPTVMTLPNASLGKGGDDDRSNSNAAILERDESNDYVIVE